MGKRGLLLFSLNTRNIGLILFAFKSLYVQNENNFFANIFAKKGLQFLYYQQF